ncbi:MAG: hypothetical protein R3C03_13080 [Pirellulaceae bacterium]
MSVQVQATRVPKRTIRNGGGLESLCELAAILSAIVGAILTLFQAGITIYVHELILVPGILMFGAAVTWLGWLGWKCVAEHLRLQKKIAGLPYSSEISRPLNSVLYRCGNCSHVTHSETRCEHCGIYFAGGGNEDSKSSEEVRDEGTAI